MDRKDFDKLDIKEQVEYINQKLSEGQSIRATVKKIGIPNSTVQDRFKSQGYSFNADLRQYIDDNMVTSVIHKVILILLNW